MATKTKQKKNTTPKARQGDDTRQALIDAGKKVFAQKGSSAATVREIAKEAGCNLSLVSYHFGGKEGLLKACIEEFARQRLESARNTLQPVHSRDELKVRLEIFLDSLLSCFASDPEVTLIIQREMELQSDVIIELQTGVMKQVFETFMDFLKQAKKSGILNDNLDPRIAAHLIFSQVHALNRTDLTSGIHQLGSISNPATRKKILDQLLNGILYGALKW